jgi:hypothetical protein
LPIGEQADASEAAAIPVPDVWNRTISQIEAESQMLARWWIGDEHEAGHARLKDQSIAGIEPYNDPFSEPAYVAYRPSSNAPNHGGTSRLNENWPASALQTFSAGDFTAGNGRDAAAHGFDFGKLGHEIADRFGSEESHPV